MPADHPSTSPSITVLVLNWNGARFLPRCLDALTAQTFPDFEVIVIDNASTDGSVDNLEDFWPNFRLVRLETNLGFAIGNNRGATYARGNWLAFLNNDAFPEPDWLSNLDRFRREHPEFTFFCSRVMDFGNQALLQNSGDVYHISGYAWPRDNLIPVEISHLTPEEVFSASAAAAMYQKEAFLEVGGFDEAFSSHYEDVDLGFRLRLKNHRCLYVPTAVVAHLGSASFGLESNRAVYQVQRNVIWSYTKNMPGKLFWKYLPVHIFANLFFLIYYSFRGQAGIVLKAKWDAFRSLPRIIRKRSAIEHNRKVAPEEIDRLLEHKFFSPFLLGRKSRKIRSMLTRSPKSADGDDLSGGGKETIDYDPLQNSAGCQPNRNR